MQPIPAFNPGDTVTYPNGLGTIQVGAADAGSKMLLYNESPFNLNIDFLNGSQSILHAWEARYWTLDGDTRQVEWDINSSLNVTSSPISLVIGELYGPTDKLEGTYPMGLIRQTNVGNPGGIVSSASTIVNDGNALLQVIEATLSGHTSSDVIVNNDGSYTLKGAGLLALAGILTHILGTLTVDGQTTFNAEFAAGDNPSSTTTFKLKPLTDAEIALRIQQHSATQSGDLIRLIDALGTTTLAKFDANGALTVTSGIFANPPAVTQNGAVTGTVSLYQLLRGTTKITVILWNNYNDTGSTKTLALPTAYTVGALCLAGGIGVSPNGGMYLTDGVTNHNMVIFTGLAAAGGSITTQGTLFQYSIAEYPNKFDSVNFPVTGGGAHTATAILIGS